MNDYNHVTMNRRIWTLILAAMIGSILVVALPVWLIYPFRAQTERIITLSYTLRRISPLITILSTSVILFLLIRSWQKISRVRKFLGVMLISIGFGTIWFSLQNHFEWMFHPLPNPSYVTAGEVKFLEPDDTVLAVAINRDAAAYPVRFLAYHHLVQDVVGGQPVVATY